MQHTAHAAVLYLEGEGGVCSWHMTGACTGTGACKAFWQLAWSGGQVGLRAEELRTCCAGVGASVYLHDVVLAHAGETGRPQYPAVSAPA
jgi:hypothetical protein